MRSHWEKRDESFAVRQSKNQLARLMRGRNVRDAKARSRRDSPPLIVSSSRFAFLRAERVKNAGSKRGRAARGIACSVFLCVAGN